mgnify:CR=1 FL=1
MEMIHEAGQYVDTVKRVCEAVGSEVTFRGTVHRVRDMSDFSFVVMRARTPRVFRLYPVHQLREERRGRKSRLL